MTTVEVPEKKQNIWSCFPDITQLRVTPLELSVQIINGKCPPDNGAICIVPPNIEKDKFLYSDDTRLLYYIGLAFANFPYLLINVLFKKELEENRFEMFCNNLLENQEVDTDILCNYFKNSIKPVSERPRTVYVAGKWGDRPRIQEMQKHVRDLEILIFHDG